MTATTTKADEEMIYQLSAGIEVPQRRYPAVWRTPGLNLSDEVKADLTYVVELLQSHVSDSQWRGHTWCFSHMADFMRKRFAPNLRTVVMAEWLRRFEDRNSPHLETLTLQQYRLPPLVFYSEVKWEKLRLTRPLLYSDPSVRGYMNPRDRNGYYVHDKTILEALMDVRSRSAELTSEVLDVQIGNQLEWIAEETIYKAIGACWATQRRINFNRSASEDGCEWVQGAYSFTYQPSFSDEIAAPCCWLCEPIYKRRAYRPQ